MQLESSNEHQLRWLGFRADLALADPEAYPKVIGTSTRESDPPAQISNSPREPRP